MSDSITEFFWFKDIDEEFIQEVIPFIAEVQSANQGAEIIFWINSPGGSLESAIVFLDYIKAAKINLTTIGLGRVDSAAILVWASGKTRVATRHCRFLFHKPEQMFASDGAVQMSLSEKECKEMAGGLKIVNKKMCKLLAQQLAAKAEDIQALVEKEDWVTAQELKRLGLLDKII